MKTVRYEDAADEELIDEIVRYELRREGLGTEFLAAAREAVGLVTENPGAWQASEHGRDVRRFVMDRFPFTIVYTELADEILIIAIAHGIWGDSPRDPTARPLVIPFENGRTGPSSCSPSCGALATPGQEGSVASRSSLAVAFCRSRPH